MSNTTSDILILPAVLKDKEENEFMMIMKKFLSWLNAPLLLLFFGEQYVKPNWYLYVSPDDIRPLDDISVPHRIWMFFLIALIPSVLFVLNYRNILKTRRHTNAIGIWIFMFAVLVLFYARPYSEYVSVFVLCYLLWQHCYEPGRIVIFYIAD